MTLREYYDFPDGMNVQQLYVGIYDQEDDDVPCMPSMMYAYYRQTARTVMKPLNTSNVTDMSYMFQTCTGLVGVPWMDTSNVTTMKNMFYDCDSLMAIPQFNTSNVTNMANMFYNCSNLEEIPPLDTSKVTSLEYTFYRCSSLTSLPPMDTSKVTNFSNMLNGCTKLTSLPPMDCSNITTKNYYPVYSNSGLTDVGGFTNMKMSWDSTYGLAKCSGLTYTSCINILNGLYDFTGNGETPNSNQGKLKVHANFLTTVGDELSIGTDKGWTITT